MTSPAPAVVTPEPQGGRRWAALLPEALGLAGVAGAALALLDPLHPSGRLWGPILAGLGLALRARRRGSVERAGFLGALALTLAIAAAVGPELLRADFGGYYVYLRSAAFDHDLDFANDTAGLGLPPQAVTPTGRRFNQYTAGPALLWSPFFLLAHVYVHVVRWGGAPYAADGFSTPYLRSAALGTIVVAVVGAWLLGRVLSARLGPAVAALGVAAAVLVSPVIYYVLVEPGMAHGLTFGLAAAGVWAADRIRSRPSPSAWITLGLLLGLLALTRLQAAAFALVAVPLLVDAVRDRRARPSWLLAAAAAALLCLVPQLVAWRVLYGSFLHVPAGPGLREWSAGAGWFDPRSPRWVDVLIAADHGLLSWTPGVLLGLLGLVLALRRWGGLAAGGLLVFAATVWINGALGDWFGSDAFGARRFDLAVPFLAIGLATVVDLCRRRPLLAPTAGLVLLAAWNLGLVALYRQRAFADAVPLERLAARQAGQLRRAAEGTLFRVGGPRGRALAYKLLVGEFLYWNLDLDGRIDLARPEGRYLADGWSAAENRDGPPQFRWAFYPQACLRLPLDLSGQDLATVITARMPGHLPAQTMTVVFNQTPLQQASLDHDWKDVPVTLPARLIVPGENLLCLRFSDGLPAENGERRAAAVSRIQLP